MKENNVSVTRVPQHLLPIHFHYSDSKPIPRQTPRVVLTEIEAANWLRISRITLQRIRLRGEIAFSRVGGTRVVYSLGQLKAYLAKCEVTARI